MNPLKIALLQIAPGQTLDENLEKGLRFCRAAKEKGADIALFPEMWSNGYRIYDRPAAEWQAEAIPADGAFIQAFGRLAGELQMAVGITLLERFQTAPRNSLILFDRFGERKLAYSKVHTCDFDMEKNLTPGEDFYVTALDTACGPVQVGAGGSHDLLRQGISGKCENPDAEGRGADPGAQCLPYGDQPSFPASGPGL